VASSNFVYKAYVGREIPQSQTDVVCHNQPALPVNADGSRWRFSVILGRVAGTPGFQVQHGTLPGIFADTKAMTDAVASAGSTCTFTAGSNVVSCTSHGFSEGQHIAFATSGVLPPEYLPSHLYRVARVIDSDSFIAEVVQQAGYSNNVASAVGSGTHKAVAAQEVSITFNPEVVADVAYLPLKQALRVVCTTDVSETAQILAIHVMNGI
jgi:hypothetical protein